MFGLSDELINEFKKIKEKYNLKMCIFGSRARGNYKYNSDIDIAILDEEICLEQKYNVMNEFDKINSEYKIDLIFVQDLKNDDFLNSIKREGEEL